jgi:hypothetical protein
MTPLDRANSPEENDDPSSPGPYPRRFKPMLTVGDIRRESAKLYRDARKGLVPAQDASRMANVLALCLRCIEGGEYEQRLSALEERLLRALH